MCESTNPEENQNNDNVNVEDLSEDDSELNDDDDDLTSEELLAIDNKLNALSVALDDMESKRESIHSQLLELLKSNRDVRKKCKNKKIYRNHLGM